MNKNFCFLFIFLMLLLNLSAVPVVVYSNNFSSSASGWSNTSIAYSNGEYFLGTNANGFGNGTIGYSLNSMTPHDTVTVTFDLYIIQSWDGNGPAGGGPDGWQFKADGNTLLSTTFANYSGGNTQGYGGPGLQSGTYTPKTGAYELGHLGFGTGDFGDTTYRLTFTFAHTSSNLGLSFISLQNQAPGDEGWGLDNVTVTVNTIPEPSTILLSLFALMLFFYKRR